MRKLYSKLFALMLVISGFLVPMQLQADVHKRVVLQAFWWNYWNENYPNSYANYLTELAPRLKEYGINAVWIPPSYKNTGTNSVGYSPFDHYDLGDKYQKGSTTTRFGTKDEFLRMVAVMHANGIEVIQDIVLNHVDGAGGTDGAGGEDPSGWDNKWKNFRYVSYATPAKSGNEADYWSRSGRWAKNWKNFHPNNAHNCNSGDICSDWWGPDICYWEGAYGKSSNVMGYNPDQTANYMRNEARNWMMWFKKQTAVDGYRWDAVKHIPDWFQQDMLWNVKYSLPSWSQGGEDMFSVGEYVGSQTEMDNYCSAVQYANGANEFTMGTFDFSLRQGIQEVIQGGGFGDIGSIPGKQQTKRYANYASQKVHRVVPFVNNHDTFRPILDDDGKYKGWDYSNQIGGNVDPFDKRLGMAYAIIMGVDGNPGIFMEDLFNLSNGKRFSHDPKSETDLPVRSSVRNLIWCHQNLGFKYGDYKIRYQSGDLLVIERAGKAIIAITDNGSTDQEVWIDTDFRNVDMKDYSGSISGTRRAWEDGRFNVKVMNTGTGLGYAVWAPDGITGGYEPYRSKSTTQEWEMADDLGDSNCQSLGQGGAIPASTHQRVVGKIYVEENKLVTYNFFPQQDGYDITLALYDLEGNLLKKQSDNKGFTGEWNATYTGWVTLKVWNNNSENISQKCWVRVQYYAPPTITDVYTDTPDTRVSIWTANGNTSTWNDCNNWEQGKVPANNATVIIPNHTPIVPIISGNLILKKLVIEQGKGNIGSPDLIVNGSLTVNELTILSGTAYICGNGTTEVSIQNGSVSNCATRIEEPSFSIELISVIPNPVESICELRFISNSIGVAYFTLTDVTGKTILTKEIPINAIGINSTNLYLGGIHTGTYIAKINCNNRISSVMIVKK